MFSNNGEVPPDDNAQHFGPAVRRVYALSNYKASGGRHGRTSANILSQHHNKNLGFRKQKPNVM